VAAGIDQDELAVILEDVHVVEFIPDFQGKVLAVLHNERRPLALDFIVDAYAQIVHKRHSQSS
jgi:hypothetical protein